MKKYILLLISLLFIPIANAYTISDYTPTVDFKMISESEVYGRGENFTLQVNAHIPDLSTVPNLASGYFFAVHLCNTPSDYLTNLEYVSYKVYLKDSNKDITSDFIANNGTCPMIYWSHWINQELFDKDIVMDITLKPKDMDYKIGDGTVKNIEFYDFKTLAVNATLEMDEPGNGLQWVVINQEKINLLMRAMPIISHTIDKEIYQINDIVQNEVRIKITDQDFFIQGNYLEIELDEGLVLDYDSVTVNGNQLNGQIILSNNSFYIPFGVILGSDEVVVRYQTKILSDGELNSMVKFGGVKTERGYYRESNQVIKVSQTSSESGALENDGIENPKTGIMLPIGIITIGLITTAGIYFYSKKNNENSKIISRQSLLF